MEERNGHPVFYEICNRMAELHDRKNRDYAKGGPPLGNFERVAKIMELYPHIEWDTPEMVAVVYMLKQFDAYMWLCNSGHVSVTGEGKLERLLDISIYSGIIQCREKDKLNELLKKICERPETSPVECHDLREARLGGPVVPSTERECGSKRNPTTVSDPPRRDNPKRAPEVRGSKRPWFRRDPL